MTWDIVGHSDLTWVFLDMRISWVWLDFEWGRWLDWVELSQINVVMLGWGA
jgi:hypothetical protein